MKEIELYCANCGGLIPAESRTKYVHRGTCTTLCKVSCLEEMEWRYAAMILNKPSDRATVKEIMRKAVK